MGDESSEVVAYLPAFLLRAVASLPATDLPWHCEVDGTMVMADLSGFTSLSERLARLGDEGAERLTATINSFFERMLQTALRYGGDTLTFGGDAILLLFDGPEHATRAAVAALEMLKQVERAAAVEADDGRVKIGMSVGAHSGTFLFAATGLADERAHLLVVGRGGELTALAESQAERGQLAVSATCKDLLPDGSMLTPTGDYWRVDKLGACALPRLAVVPASVSAEQLRGLSPFLPPYARLVEENGVEQTTLTPEHRRTVVAFVNILGLNEVIDSAGIDVAVQQLQVYSAMLTRLASKHHGFVVSSDIATRGSKLIVTFGAPVAHEYAPANAARFALDLDEEVRRSGLGLSHKIGVNGGHVFAGEVGPSFRRQYTVMGDAVNLAARLMGAAELGEALVSRSLLNYVSHDLCARELAPIKVKGKEKPVAVCVLEQEGQTGAQIHGGLEQGRYQRRLFGRRAELDLIARRWERARRGKGQTIVVEGDAGVGKTRLLEEALRPMSRVSRVTRASCFEHLQAAPFTPWMNVLRSILEIPRGDSAARRTEAVRVYVELRLADLAEFGSLLNPMLGLSLPQSQVVSSLDAQTRRQKLFEMITRILAESAGDGGHVVVMEDLHWMDESSLALVEHVTQHLAGASILLLLSTRPTENAAELTDIGVTRVVLAELSQSESLAMVREALRIADLPSEVGEAVYAKTKGNPLFLEEVIHSLQAPGILERILSASSVTRAAELAALEIPDRVQGLLMSRIDSLPPDAREVLKAGSVVGRSFGETVLDGIDDPALRLVSLDRAFDELIAAALVVPGEQADETAVTFRHALVQDVAYESLPFSRRRELHRQVARYLESVQVAPDHAVLVHHYGHAGDDEKTRLHAVRAAESSVSVYANLEAVDYLSVALQTTRGRTARDACLRSRFDELIGDSFATLARHDDAVIRFSRARRRWASSAVRRISEDALRELAPLEDADARDSLLCWKIAVSVERGQAAYKRALRWLVKAADGPHDGRLSARLVITRGGVLSRLGRYREAAHFGEEGVALARRDGDAALQAYALTLLGVAFSGLGLLHRAMECDREAVALYEQAGDLVGLALSQSNLGASYMAIGELARALEPVESALALQARIGDLNGVSVQHVNLGAVLLQRGEVEAAVEHLEQAVGLRADASPVTTGYALVFLCQGRVRLGDLEAAGRALTEGREILESIDAKMFLLDAGVVDVELRLAQGDLQDAERACRKVLSEAQWMGAGLSEAQALCMLGRVELEKGDPKPARAALEKAVALAAEIGSDYERARALAVLARARAACEEPDEACEDTLAEAIRMFRKMGARRDLDEASAVRAHLAAPPEKSLLVSRVAAP